MTKYAHLLWGGFVTLVAIGIIVWILRDNQAQIDAVVGNSTPSPDEGTEKLNGLAPNNALVEVPSVDLTYNVPQPGVIAPVNTNQEYITQGQALVAASDSADDVLRNLLAVNLPANDYVM